MTAPIRSFAIVLSVALDFVVGVFIGSIAMAFALLMGADTGYGWLFGVALLLVVLSTGFADRVLLPRRATEHPAPARLWRRLAFAAGLGVGAVTMLIRLEILPWGTVP